MTDERFSDDLPHFLEPHVASEPRFRCPKCKQKRGVDISFGYPTPELVEQFNRNEAVLGGCSLPLIGDPERQCLDCGHQWEIVRRVSRKELVSLPSSKARAQNE